MKYELKPMGVAEILDTSFKVFVDNLKPVVQLSLLLTVPMFIVEQIQSNADDMGMAGLALGLVSALVVIVAYPYVYGGVLRIIADRYLGANTSVGDALRFVHGAYWPVVLTATTTSLLIALGFMFFFLPGLWLLVRYIFSAHSVILEGTQGGDARARSSDLVEGSFLKICWLGAVITVVTLAVGPVGASLTGVLGLPSLLAGLISSALGLLLTGFTSTVWVVAYFAQRCEKEGFDVEMLARGVGGETAPVETRLGY